jgi:hypothetical protein
MPHVQLAPRNVFVFDNTGTSPVLVAGCRQFGNMTNNEFYSCLAICFRQPIAHQFRVVDTSNNIVPYDDNVLQQENYYVIAASPSRSIFSHINKQQAIRSFSYR